MAKAAGVQPPQRALAGTAGLMVTAYGDDERPPPGRRGRRRGIHDKACRFRSAEGEPITTMPTGLA
jgi:hypothetical protein